MKAQRILITGGTGFLGGHLTKKLRHLGHSVDSIGSKDADLTKKSALDRYSGNKYNTIFHLAAWTQAGDFCLHHPGEQWIINQQINTNILNWWHKSQPNAKLVAIGSSCCYEPGTPHTEDNILKGTPTESLYTYAMTKRMLLVGLMALNKQYGLNYLYLVPSTLYGADYHLDGRQMHFIFDLIRKIINGKNSSEVVTLWGDGNQRRELIHVNDFISCAIQLTENVNNTVVNIGGGVDYTIKDFAEIICNQIGYNHDSIIYDESRYVGAKSKLLVIDKLNSILSGYSPYSIKAGIREVIDWYHQKLQQKNQ